MYVRAIILGCFLFAIALAGEQARLRFTQAKLDAEHYQDSPLSIHTAGTIIKYTARAEFEFPLDSALFAAYENSYSPRLVRYLTYHHGSVIPFWETPPELRFELDLLTQLLTKQRCFTVVNNFTGVRHTRFQILPESERYLFAYAFEDGTIFYEEDKWDPQLGPQLILVNTTNYSLPSPEIGLDTICLCKHRFRKVSTEQLSMNLDHVQPDLSIEFLRLMSNPDTTVY